MPSTKGYRSYHGKGGAGRIVLIVLLCLILLAAVGFLVLQRYAVYGSDGSIRFDLPWKQTEEPSDPSAPDGASRTPDAPDDSPDVIIDEPEPPAKPELTELHGAELSESVLRGSADAALTAVPEGANAVALRVKNARGELRPAGSHRRQCRQGRQRRECRHCGADRERGLHHRPHQRHARQPLFLCPYGRRRCAAAQLRRLHLVRSRQHLLFGAGKARRAAVHRLRRARMCGAWL